MKHLTVLYAVQPTLKKQIVPITRIYNLNVSTFFVASTCLGNVSCTGVFHERFSPIFANLPKFGSVSDCDPKTWQVW